MIDPRLSEFESGMSSIPWLGRAMMEAWLLAGGSGARSPVSEAILRQAQEQRSRFDEDWTERVEAQGYRIRAGAMLQLGDDEWRVLSTMREEFRIAAGRDDVEAQLRLVELAAGVLRSVSMDPADEWLDDVPHDLESSVVAARVNQERAQFFDRYFAAKDASGLTTQREVAEAAGLSPATVQAIEARRVRPQFKTVQRLAEAFGVETSALLGD